MRGIVRMTGPDAITIAGHFFIPGDHTTIERQRGFTVSSGELSLADDLPAIPATVWLFRAPHSYTRQDLVEFHTIGSPPVLNMLLHRCLHKQARLAEPGEFTARAFLTGALTIAEAEAVAATINARTDNQLRQARKMMRGGLVQQIESWRAELIELTALVVADIDFAEEPIDFITPSELASRVHHLHTRIGKLVAATIASERSELLPQVLLLGPPNAGKSTLLNRLSGMDRAISSAVSGTTRDILAAPVKLPHLEIMMLDAAGIDEEHDHITRLGTRRAKGVATTADLICVILDSSVSADQTLSHARQLAALAVAPTMAVICKSDLVDQATLSKITTMIETLQIGPVVEVSAHTGLGLARLIQMIEREINTERHAEWGHGHADEYVVVSARQLAALKGAQQSLKNAVDVVSGAADVLDVAELAAFELHEALDWLGTISGAVTTDDLLERIFSSFCIGK